MQWKVNWGGVEDKLLKNFRNYLKQPLWSLWVISSIFFKILPLETILKRKKWFFEKSFRKCIELLTDFSRNIWSHRTTLVMAPVKIFLTFQNWKLEFQRWFFDKKSGISWVTLNNKRYLENILDEDVHSKCGLNATDLITVGQNVFCKKNQKVSSCEQEKLIFRDFPKFLS